MLSDRLDKFTGSPRRSHFAVAGTLLAISLCCGAIIFAPRSNRPAPTPTIANTATEALAEVGQRGNVAQAPQATQAPSETALPTETPGPATEVSVPTDTALPPTATDAPPSATPLPPTATLTAVPEVAVVQASATTAPALPTSTLAPVLPTNTSAPVVPSDTPVPTAAPPGDVRIIGIHADGDVPQVESDEWVAVQNVGGTAIDIGGWRINAGDPGQDFTFPGGFVLQPGGACRVYTNESHPETCGLSFGNGRAIWANSGDCGFLYRQDGSEASRYCY